MNFYAISALVNVVTSIVLGVLVLFQNPRHRANQLFFLFTLAVATWGYAYFSWQIASDPNMALFWVHVLMAGAILIPFLYFHFVVRFLNLQQELRWFVWVGYISAAFFSIVNWHPLFISSIGSRGGFDFWPIAGPLFSLFLIIWVLYAAYPVRLLFKHLRTTDRAEDRAQIKYILVGTAIGYIGGCTNYFLWYGIPILPFGNITASVYIVLVAYAILKHGLFNMKAIAAEFLVFVLWLFVFIRMLIASTTPEQFIEGGFLLVILIVGVMLIRSVDREVEQRERIQKLVEELEATNKGQENLIHIMNHQIKGYLGTARNIFAELSQSNDYGTMPEPSKPLLAKGFEEMTAGVDYVQQILKGASARSGTLSYTMLPLDLKPLVSKLLDKQKEVAEKNGLSFESIIADGNYDIVGDATMLEEAFKNLITNAVKYNNPKGSIAVTLSRTGEKILFAVKDTGRGISKEDEPQLFKPGGVGKDSIKYNIESSGFGLAFVKPVAEKHGGKVWFVSNSPEKGTTFFVELPVT